MPEDESAVVTPASAPVDDGRIQRSPVPMTVPPPPNPPGSLGYGIMEAESKKIERRFVATAALTGVLSNPNLVSINYDSDGLIRHAVGLADALLAALEK